MDAEKLRKAAFEGNIGDEQRVYISEFDDEYLTRQDIIQAIEKYKSLIFEMLTKEDEAEFDEVSYSALNEGSRRYLEVYLSKEVIIGFDESEVVKQSHSFVDSSTGLIYAEQSSQFALGNVFLPPDIIKQKTLNFNGRLKPQTGSLVELIYVQKLNLDATNAFEENVLFAAVASLNLVVVEFLLSEKLKHSININQKNSRGSNVLALCATKTGSKAEDIMKMLLAIGCDVSSVDVFGRTPLHVACFLGNLGLAEILLEYGGSKTIKDLDGKTPLDYTLQESCHVSESGISSFNPTLKNMLSA